jgi:hypothetical protein
MEVVPCILDNSNFKRALEIFQSYVGKFSPFLYDGKFVFSSHCSMEVENVLSFTICI